MPGRSYLTVTTALPFRERKCDLAPLLEHFLEEAARADGNQTIAARLLGISQPALSKRLKFRGIVPD